MDTENNALCEHPELSLSKGGRKHEITAAGYRAVDSAGPESGIRAAGPTVSVGGGVGARAAQEQLGSVMQQAQHVFSQSVHAGVTHLLQVKDVLQEERHLLLWEQNPAFKA